MKITISFKNITTFNYATVLADVHSLECAIDNQNNLIWTNNLDGFVAAFNDGGIDEEEYNATIGIKKDYTKLAMRLLAEAESVKDEEMVENQ